MTASTYSELIYKHVARLLYKEADAVRVGDDLAIRAVWSLALALIPVYEDDFENFASGFVREIALWMGLKQDAPEMAIDYGDKIRANFPEVFED